MKSGFVIKEASSRFKLSELLGALSGINKTHGNVVQIFNPDYVIDRAHLEGAYLNAMSAFKSRTNISKSVATEMLLYAAMTRQINEAIKLVGAKSGRRFIFFASSKSAYAKVRELLASAKECKPSEKHASDTARMFGISPEKDLDVFVLQKIAVSRL